MDFSYSQEQEMLRESAAKFAAKGYGLRSRARDAAVPLVLYHIRHALRVRARLIDWWQ